MAHSNLNMKEKLTFRKKIKYMTAIDLVYKDKKKVESIISINKSLKVIFIIL